MEVGQQANFTQNSVCLEGREEEEDQEEEEEREEEKWRRMTGIWDQRISAALHQLHTGSWTLGLGSSGDLI